MRLALITQIRNESERLKEWILYHSKVIGFDHFLIYLDNSSDDSEEVLKSLQSKFSIEIRHTDKMGEYPEGNFFHWDDPKGVNLCNRQVNSFTEGFRLLKYDYDWIGILDVDEWIVPVDLDNFNFKEELSSFNTNSLYLQSYSFKPPFDVNKSITEQNMFRWSLDEKMNSTHHSTGKTVFRGKICLDKDPRVGVHWGPEVHEYSLVEGGPHQNGVTGYKKYLLHHFQSHFYNGGKPVTDDQHQIYDDSLVKLFEKYKLKNYFKN
jgi:hypothetical protein